MTRKKTIAIISSTRWLWPASAVIGRIKSAENKRLVWGPNSKFETCATQQWITLLRCLNMDAWETWTRRREGTIFMFLPILKYVTITCAMTVSLNFSSRRNEERERGRWAIGQQEEEKVEKELWVNKWRAGEKWPYGCKIITHLFISDNNSFFYIQINTRFGTDENFTILINLLGGSRIAK